VAKAVETYRGVAYPWFCDSMGHLNTQFYAAMFDTASVQFLSVLAPYAELRPKGIGWADVRQLIEYKREVRHGAVLVARTTLKRIGTKSVEFVHALSNVETGVLHATSENICVLFDLEKRVGLPLDDAIRCRAAALLGGGD